MTVLAPIHELDPATRAYCAAVCDNDHRVEDAVLAVVFERRPLRTTARERGISRGALDWRVRRFRLLYAGYLRRQREAGV